MNDIFYLLIPFSIIVIALGGHFFLDWLSYRREQKRDKLRNAWWDDLENKAELDRKLSDDPGCENEEVLNPKHWESFSYDDKN